MKLVVGTPWSSPFMFTEYVDATLAMRHPAGVEVAFVRGQGWCPARRHNDICEQAMRQGADLICIIGADQKHPPDLLERLVVHVRDGREVVTAMVPTRGFVSWQAMQPFQPMAWRFKPGNLDGRAPYRSMELDGDQIEVVRKRTGMQLVDFIGSGVLLFRREHLETLGQPWFHETIRPTDFKRRANMDCTFVWRLQTEAHAKVWCDTDIQVEHLHIFPIDDTYSERFADWAEPGVGDPEVCRFAPEPVTAGNGSG